MQTGLHPPNDLLSVRKRRKQPHTRSFPGNIHSKLRVLSSKLGRMRDPGPPRTMLCWYSVGNDLVILYSGNSASFKSANFEGGSGFLWVQKTSRSVLFPRNGQKNGNDMYNNILSYTSERCPPLRLDFILSMIIDLQSLRWFQVPSSLVRHLSEFRLFFSSKIMYVWHSLLECERWRHNVVLYSNHSLCNILSRSALNTSIITNSKLGSRSRFLQTDSKHCKLPWSTSEPNLEI